jgi:hypothetical protein
MNNLTNNYRRWLLDKVSTANRTNGSMCDGRSAIDRIFDTVDKLGNTEIGNRYCRSTCDRKDCDTCYVRQAKCNDDQSLEL